MSELPKEPRYLALLPGDSLKIGDLTSRRVYPKAAHAQLAEPRGRLYVLTEDGKNEEGDPMHRVIAQAGVYPLTLMETPVVGFGAQAEGAYCLRDLGPRGDLERYVIHFRNDQSGGYHGGQYHQALSTALSSFELKAEQERKRLAAYLRRRLAGEPA